MTATAIMAGGNLRPPLPGNGPEAGPQAARLALPTQHRAASFAPASFNDAENTVDVIWSTGADVTRFDWWEGQYYTEALSLEPGACDLTRLAGGAAPVLDSHYSYGLASQIGRVVSASIDGGVATATLQLSTREDIAGVVADIKAGIIRNISVGYTVQAYSVEKREGQMDRWVATDWTPVELSFVTIPADPSAQTRASAPLHPVQFHHVRAVADVSSGTDQPGNLEVRDMLEENAPGAGPVTTTGNLTPPAVVQPPAAPSPIEQRGAPGGGNPIGATLVDYVRRAAPAAGLSNEAAFDVIAAARDEGHARELILERAMQNQQQRGGPRPIGSPTASLIVDHTDPSGMIEAMGGALAKRAMFKPPEGREADFMSHSVLDMVAEIARARGVPFNPRNRGALADLVLTRSSAMSSTSDFPLILASAANKIMLPAYQNTPKSYMEWAQRQSFNDFKAHNFYRLGDFPALVAVTEGGELNYGAPGEKRELVTPGMYASGFKLSRQAIINDDMSAFSQVGQMAGARAANDENTLVYSVIANDGPTLVEGATTLYSTAAARLNKAASGTVINPTNIGAGRSAVRKQTGVAAAAGPTATPRLLNLDAYILVVGPDKEAEALSQVVQLTPSTTSNVNPYSNRLRVVVDPNVSGTRWHLFTDPMWSPIVYGYLEGSDGPVLLSEIDFDTQSVKYRLQLDFAAGARDWRGTWLNTGA